MVEKRPKLIVFDLDYTLWPFWVDTHVIPPFKKSSLQTIRDSRGHLVECYEQVPQVLNNLHKQGYILGVASRTGEIKGALQLIEMFGWNKYFAHKEIYPGQKTTHFENIRKKSSIPFEEMLFFDDENRNVSDVNGIGVMSILVRDGVTESVIENSLKQFKKQQQ